MKHTKGKWEITSSNYKTGFYHITAPDLTSKTERRVLVTDLKYGNHPEKSYLDRAQANAKLIAASPELLEVCIELYEGDYGLSGAIADQLIKAIKKATE